MASNPAAQAASVSTPLALRPREAARTLGLSERSLWALTAPRGPIPAAKVGRSVLYRFAALEAWLAAEAAKSVPTAPQPAAAQPPAPPRTTAG